MATDPYPTSALVVPGTVRRLRPWLAGLLSVLVPGAGQLYAGARRRGLLLLSIGAMLALATLAVWLQGELTVLRLLLSPSVLLALLAGNAVVFAFRAYAAIDAHRLARVGNVPTSRGSAPAAALVLLVLTAAPHVAAGYYDFRSYDLLRSVFADEEPERPALIVAAAAQPPPALPVPAAPTQPAAAPAPGAGPVAPLPATTAPAEEPEDDPAFWQRRGRLNVLLIGADAGPGRWGLRTDTMVVVSIETATRRTAIFSIPRNLQYVPFPPSAATDLDTFPDILNALWQYAEGRPELFPGARRPGATALKATLGYLLGLRIDYYALVDLRGFVEVVDALGGVTVDVRDRVYDAGVSPPKEGEPWIVVDLQPGRHHLDGRLALGYVRTRWATSDYDRMQRQRCTIAALAAQASLPRLLKAFPKLASTMKRYVLTDIPIKALPDLLELVTSIDTKSMVAVSFVPPLFSPVADLQTIRAAVQQAIRKGVRPDPDTGLVTVRAACS